MFGVGYLEGWDEEPSTSTESRPGVWDIASFLALFGRPPFFATALLCALTSSHTCTENKLVRSPKLGG